VLAPVLARLDAIPGVRESRVDASGRYFALTLAAGAGAGEVAAGAREALGERTAALGAADAEAQLAARGRGDPWLAAVEVMALSYVEARLLAVRLAAALGRACELTEEEREPLAEALRAALFAAMERVHAEGGARSSGWIHARWPAIAEAVLARGQGAASAPLGAALRRPLAELLADAP